MPDRNTDSSQFPNGKKSVVLVLSVAIGLTGIFWYLLWIGGGLIGGDVYSYYLPQKTYLAEQLQAGVLPLWNNKTGFGYPLLAESQTGLFYPFHLICYRLFEVNTAYSVVHLIHYILTFCFCWLYARRLNLSNSAALFAALIFTYSWFPSRVCHEWAIVTGMYFPAALWALESSLQENKKGYLLALSLLLGLQLLAGHFNLAFITQLTLVCYASIRAWQNYRARPNVEQSLNSQREMFQSLALILGGIAFAYLLAAVQLLPSWELKQISQRAAVADTFDPGYGHIPPLYLSQIIAPWLWYAPDIDTDRAIQNLLYGAIPSGTNKVEAHLYFGMLPLLLIAANFFTVTAEQRDVQNYKRLWCWLGLVALLFATGWPIVLLKFLPGFSYFQGPGRYGIVTTMAVAIWAGFALDMLLLQRSRMRNAILLILVFSLTTADYWLVSRLVNYATVVPKPTISQRSESAIVQILQAESQPIRIWGPGANMLNNLGLTQYPVYLGIGPSQYFDANLMLPTAEDDSQHNPALINQQVDWLRKSGVTHLIRFEPLDEQRWPVKLLFKGLDRVLNPAWARIEPIYLYKLLGSRGRVSLRNSRAGDKAIIEHYSANRVDIATHIPWIPNEQERTVRLILTDLAYPGWQVYIDGKPATDEVEAELFRSVELQPGQSKVSWRYQPASYRWGCLISLMAVGATLICGIRLYGSSHRQNHSETS